MSLTLVFDKDSIPPIAELSARGVRSDEVALNRSSCATEHLFVGIWVNGESAKRDSMINVG